MGLLPNTLIEYGNIFQLSENKMRKTGKIKALKTNWPAGLVRGGSRRQRFNREELLTALNCINTGAGQSEWSSRSRYAHSYRNNQRLCYVTQLLHSVGQQSLENSPTFPDGLGDEVAMWRKLRQNRISICMISKDRVKCIIPPCAINKLHWTLLFSIQLIPTAFV